MLRAIKTSFLIIILLTSAAVKADEGMWLLPRLGQYNIDKMQQMGLRLSAEEIFSNYETSLKDAVVNVGNIGTGSVISPKGLVITNHHVIYDYIQKLSTPENDLLTEGFWAGNYQEEIPAPGLTITFLHQIIDVTSEVKAEIAATEARGGNVSMMIIGRRIAAQKTRGTTMHGFLSPVYHGEMYYLYLYETFNDIRLVGAPPSSIGKFGGDTDNFVWPRHTGDFGFIRIYASADGKPADYSADNVPFEPKHYLKVSAEGIRENDFTLVMGYPGSTQRYLASSQVEDLMQITHPGRVLARGKRLEIIMNDMLADDNVRLKYAAKHFTSSNGYKFSEGQLDQLQRWDVLSLVEQQENEFMQWVGSDPLRLEKYGNVLEQIRASVESKRRTAYAHHLLNESLMMGTELYVAGIRASVFKNNAAKEAGSRKQLKEIARNRLLDRQRSFYQDYHAPTDQKVVAAMMKTLKQELDADDLPDIYQYIEKKYGGNIDGFVQELFATSMLVNTQRLEKFLRRPSVKKLEKDLAVRYAESIYQKAIALRNINNELGEGEKLGSRLYLQALREMNQGQPMYPDANFTMRLTYGKVQGYSSRNAVFYKPFSTLSGVAQKHIPGDYEFEAPQKLLDLYQRADFGPYAAGNSMPVNFLSDNDITGGNSGSPVMNSQGHLIGLAFDGNWESLAGEVIFLPEINRSINVDIRYVLFVVDKFAGADHILREISIHSPETETVLSE